MSIAFSIFDALTVKAKKFFSSAVRYAGKLYAAISFWIISSCSVRFFGETTKAAYARVLISMEETRSGLNPLCNNFSKNAIEERVTAIMKIKKSSIFSLVLASALVVCVTTAFATSAAAKNNNSISVPSIIYRDDAANIKLAHVGGSVSWLSIASSKLKSGSIAGMP